MKDCFQTIRVYVDIESKYQIRELEAVKQESILNLAKLIGILDVKVSPEEDRREHLTRIGPGPDSDDSGGSNSSRQAL